MSYETILYTKEKGLGIITLNRPAQGNSLNEQLLRDMNAVLNEIEKDEEVRVVVITGGEKFFCSGADLKEPRQPGRSQRANQLFSRVEKFSKPTLAAINGYALGGGLEISLCCDFRVAAEDSRLGTPEVKVGTIPSGGATLRLPRLIGIAKAKEFLLLGEPVTGTQALALGMVNRVAPPGKALEETQELAQILMDRPPLSLKAIKDCVLEGQLMETESAVESIIRTADLLRNTEDYQEGRKAFREKRKPVWKGR
jgi:enoyl-CoA hydratase/carnithine racemase